MYNTCTIEFSHIKNESFRVYIIPSFVYCTNILCILYVIGIGIMCICTVYTSDIRCYIHKYHFKSIFIVELDLYWMKGELCFLINFYLIYLLNVRFVQITNNVCYENHRCCYILCMYVHVRYVHVCVEIGNFCVPIYPYMKMGWWFLAVVVVFGSGGGVVVMLCVYIYKLM